MKKLPLFLTAYSPSSKTAIGVQNRYFLEAFDEWLMVYWREDGEGRRDPRAVSLAGPFGKRIGNSDRRDLVARLLRKSGADWWSGHRLKARRQAWFAHRFKSRVSAVYAAPLDAAEAARCRHLLELLQRPFLLHLWDSLNGPLADDENFVWLVQNAANIMVISENAARDVQNLGRDASLLLFMRRPNGNRAGPPDGLKIRIVTLGYLGEYAPGLQMLDEAIERLESKGLSFELLYIGVESGVSQVNRSLRHSWTATGFLSDEDRDRELASGHAAFMLGPLEPPEEDHRSRYSIPSRSLDFMTSGLPLIGVIHPRSATGEFLTGLGLSAAVGGGVDTIADRLEALSHPATWRTASTESLQAFETAMSDLPSHRLRRAMDAITSDEA